MKRFVLPVLFLITASATAQDEPRLLAESPPSFVTVHDVDAKDNVLIAKKFETKQVTVNVAKNVEVEGQKRTIQVPEIRSIVKEIEVKYSLAGAKIQTADGKEMTVDDLIKRAPRGTVILVAPPIGKVDPAYRTVLKPDTILLLVTPMPPR